MAYKQNFGRDNLTNPDIAALTKPSDFNKALYESSRNVQNTLNTDQSSGVLSNPKLTTFRPRGNDMYAQSLKDANVIEPSFTEEPSNGDNSRYKFLSSRFLINPSRSDFADRQTDNTYGDGQREGGATTISEDKRTLENARAGRAYFGVRKTLKEAEQGAKVSANISENVQRAKETLNENLFKASIETARSDMRADPFLRRTLPVKTHPTTGKKIINDEVSYANASMLQNYINQSRNATKAQNTSDKLKFITQDFAKDKASGKFSLNSNNSSNSNINTNNLFKNSTLTTDVTDGKKKRFKF